MSDLPLFAVYNDEGIWSRGRTAQEAFAGFQETVGQDQANFPGPRVAKMTPRLAESVHQHGFNCKYDSFTAVGRLDLPEDKGRYAV